MNLDVETLATPIGELVLVYEGEALVHIDFEDDAPRRDVQLARRYGTYRLIRRTKHHRARARFAKYFAGDASALDELDEGIVLSPGGTGTQRRVWTALRTIPTGETLSYGVLAARVGIPGAARAVGRINGQNPLGLVVPCHRVIGRDGSLTGYASGVERKRWLLEHEGALR